MLLQNLRRSSLQLCCTVWVNIAWVNTNKLSFDPVWRCLLWSNFSFESDPIIFNRIVGCYSVFEYFVVGHRHFQGTVLAGELAKNVMFMWTLQSKHQQCVKKIRFYLKSNAMQISSWEKPVSCIGQWGNLGTCAICHLLCFTACIHVLTLEFVFWKHGSCSCITFKL